MTVELVSARGWGARGHDTRPNLARSIAEHKRALHSEGDARAYVAMQDRILLLAEKAKA